MPEVAHTSGTSIESVEPGERLQLDPSRDQTLVVLEGLLYVALKREEVVLVPGVSLTIAAGRPRRARSAGDRTARVMVQDAPALVSQAA